MNHYGPDELPKRQPSQSKPDVQELQELTHGTSWDYRAGSPHLAHWQLYTRLVNTVLSSLRTVSEGRLPATVLEIGAGHGGYTEPLLAAGHQVTATEMSRPSLARLQERFGKNNSFRCAFDPDGSLDILDGQRFSLILCVSVLHHIPDYEAFLTRALSRHLAVGGNFVSVQDPLWYPTMPASTRRFDRAAYLSWRLTRGDYKQGIQTQLRRWRGVYDQSNPADMVEYHVVRNGVNQEALVAMLRKSFNHVQLGCYWSTQGAALQRIGTSLGLRNTFMLSAQGNRADAHSDPNAP